MEANIPKKYFILLKITIFLFVLLNLAIFVKGNLTPITWQQHEIAHLNFFWSTTIDDQADNTLHSGLKASDFLKPFIVQETEEGWFRARQFSTLIEMLSFKFWQYFNVVSFRSYTLILLHGVNAILLLFLMNRLCQSRFVSLLCVGLFLNSGVAFSTLLFPFRNAKILVTTLFLLAWLILLKNSSQSSILENKRFNVFCIISLLALFTDEISFVIFPFILIAVMSQYGFKALNNRKTVIVCTGTMLIFLVLYTIDYMTVLSLNNAPGVLARFI